MMESHYVDQYIKNKRTGGGGPNSSASTTQDPHTSTARPSSRSGHYRSSSLGNNTNNNNRQPSISSAAQHLLSAAQRAQHEVDTVNGAAEQLALHQEASERVERQQQLLSERVDTASLQAAAAEDKVTYLAKMMSQMKQDMQDNDKKLREENSDLRSKLKRFEKHMEQEREVREKQTENLTSYVRETVERHVENHVRPLRTELDRQTANNATILQQINKDQERARKEVDEVRQKADTFLQLKNEVQNFCEKFAENERRANREHLDKHLEEFRITNDGMNEKVRDARAKIEDMNDKVDQATQSQHEIRRTLEDVKRRSDPVKDWCEDKITHVRSELRDFIIREDEKLSANLHLQLANANQCIELNENNFNELRQELDTLVTTTQTHVKKSEEHVAKSADNIQDLRQVTDQSRELLVQQLEATKEWASRNIMRLKKHLDLAVSDMSATRQAQLEIQSNFQRLTQAHIDEKNALVDQLNRKTKEAAVLTQQVDKEVNEVADMIHNWEESRRHSQMKRQTKDELRALSHMP